jgi:16S rRNA (uracil1498-N3)-methyltransferase
MTRRFFVPASSIRDGRARLPADEAHHLRHVLRIGPGARIDVFDGTGACYAGIVETRGSEVWVAGLTAAPARPEPPLEVTLGLALIRLERFEWAIEKATELGVRAIVPIRAERSEVRLTDTRVPVRRERWLRIVRGAAKQSRRARVPEVEPPCALAELLARTRAGGIGLLLAEAGGEAWRPPGRLGSIVVAVGPEGGWTAGELAAAAAAGWLTVGLGPRVLRAETAAVAALAIVQFTAGDLGPSEESLDPGRLG